MNKNKKTIWKDKRGFLLRSWVVGFVLFSAVFALFFVINTNFSDEYDSSDIISGEYNSSYNVISNITGDYDPVFEGLGSEDSGLWKFIGGDAGVLSAVFKTIKVTFASVEVLDSVTKSSTLQFIISSVIS